MIKQIIYGTLGFSASAVLIGGMLANIPDVYIANTTVDEGDRHGDDHEEDLYLHDEYHDEYMDDMYADEWDEYPEDKDEPFDEYADTYDDGGEHPLPSLFNTYHVELGEGLAGEDDMGRRNPMFFWDYASSDYSAGASYEWADTVENADIEEGNMLGYDTNANPQGGEQIVKVETLSIEEKFAQVAVLPVDEQFYNITSAYGPRVDPIERDREAFHGGLDIAAAGINGANIYSVLPGAVSHIDENPAGYGHFVVVNHGDFTTLYAHMLEETPLEIGDTVEAGDVIGRVGSTGRSTGPHLHFEVQVDSVKVDPKPLLDLIGTGSADAPARPLQDETSSVVESDALEEPAKEDTSDKESEAKEDTEPDA